MERPFWVAPYEDMEFWENFIQIYRNNPILWWTKYDNTIDLLKKKDARKKAILELLDYCNSVRTDINREFVNVNIQKIRASYIKEYKLAKKKERTGKTYKSTLLFYDKLSFLACEEENNVEVLNEIKNVFLRNLQMKPPNEKVFTTVDLKTPAPTIILSSTVQVKSNKTPTKNISNKVQLSESNRLKSPNIKVEIYDSDDSSGSPQCKPIKSNKFSIKNISNDVQLSESNRSKSPNIKVEIYDSENSSSTSTLHESISIDESIAEEEIIKEEPKLYSESYDDDDFVEIDLVDDLFMCQENDSNENTRKCKRLSEISEENELTKSSSPKKQCIDTNSVIGNVGKKTDRSLLLREAKDSIQKSSEPEYDPYAKDVSLNLKTLNPKQRIYARKIIKDIFYYGKLNMLTEKSRLLP